MQGPQNECLLEFKAGTFVQVGDRITPDKRRGSVKIIKDSQGVNTFTWQDLGSSNPVDKIMVFPGEAKFEKVKQSKDRVYILQFHANKNQRWFYWMQNPDKEGDDENCEKVNKLLRGETVEAAGETISAEPSRP
jgi:26S proteasome regulatory subunit N13